jgi:hypothetical protein
MKGAMIDVRGGDQAERSVGLGGIDRQIVAELNHRDLLRASPAASK